MKTNAISLCSCALLKIGASSITSFNDGTVESEIASALYPHIRDSLISSYPWSFATTHTILPRLEETPKADFSYAFLLPIDFLRVISIGQNNKGDGLEYRIFGNKLFADIDCVTLTYIFRPNEADMPAYFTSLLTSYLAKEFCLPITESTSRAEFLTKEAEEMYQRAKLTDSQQNPPQVISDCPLIEVRK